MARIGWLFVFLFVTGCVHQAAKLAVDSSEKITIFLYQSNLLPAATSDEALEVVFAEYFRHLGRVGPNGEVGVALVFPYLSWTIGSGSGPYAIPEKIRQQHESIVRVAYRLKIPLMVQFNGGPWHSPSADSAFVKYWKTVDGGSYLSRYKDGRVNESITQTGKIAKAKLDKYLSYEPYGDKKEDSLFFTLSPYAKDFRNARVAALRVAVKFWKSLNDKYPGAIRAFTTDSEVSNLSFRNAPDNSRNLPIGYESWNTRPFCAENQVSDCAKFFRREFSYTEDLERKWQEFRSKNHQKFIQDTVNTIREEFTVTPVYTHQIALLDEEKFLTNYRGQDLASPQWTAIVDSARPGYTVYTYAGDHDAKKRRFVEEVRRKVGQRSWGFLEFNSGEAFVGNKIELAEFTKSFLIFARVNGVRVVAPLSWEANSLDKGIKDSGVDDGIRHMIEDTGN